jgi:hypothetical protein
MVADESHRIPQNGQCLRDEQAELAVTKDQAWTFGAGSQLFDDLARRRERLREYGGVIRDGVRNPQKVPCRNQKLLRK